MSETFTTTQETNDESFDDWNEDAERYAAQALAQARAARQPNQASKTVGRAPPPTPVHDATTQAKAIPALIPNQNKTGHFPALISRSALFSVARLDRKIMNKNTAPKSQGSYCLKMTGPTLTMLDKSVWETVIDLAKNALLDMNDPLDTSLSEIARLVGIATSGGRVLDSVSESLQRLALTNIEATLSKGFACSGKLLESVEKRATGVRIRLDPTLAKPLLANDYQFLIASVRRRSLGSVLAQWLHDFLSTHEPGLPLTLGYLRQLCGYAAQKRRFPESLEAALADLAKNAPALVTGHTIHRGVKDSDLWTVEIGRGGEKPSYQQPIKLNAHRNPGTVVGKRGRVAL